MTKSERRQAIVTDLLAAVIKNLEAHPVKQKTRQAITRIKARDTAIKSALPAGDKTYSMRVDAAKQIIRQYPAEMTAESWLSACLLLVDDLVRQMPGKYPLLKDWRYLHGTLFTIYTHLDPDLSTGPAQARGQSLGEKLKKIVWS